MAEQQTLSLEECFQIADETPGQIDMTNIFPNAGHYFVEVDELIPGINRADPDHLKPYVRVPLSILRVEGQEKSGLVGRSFSIFLRSHSQHAQCIACVTASSLMSPP